MNNKILGATLVAIAALVGTPIMAEAITDLNGVRVQMDNAGNFKGIVFKTLDVVPKDGLALSGGYAIPTENGDFIAVTSHPEFLDSEKQLQYGVAIWHSHIVKVTEENESCEVAIDAVSYEDSSGKVLIRDGSSKILVKTIANGTQTYFDFISGTDLEFTVGNPIYIDTDRPNRFVESISFDLIVVEDGSICLGEVTEFEDGSGGAEYVTEDGTVNIGPPVIEVPKTKGN